MRGFRRCRLRRAQAQTPFICIGLGPVGANRCHPPSQSGPNASDIAAAARMTPSERNGVIESMVARLAERMAKDGPMSRDGCA